MGGDPQYPWMSFERGDLKVTITDVPKEAQHPFDIHMGMIVEFYS